MKTTLRALVATTVVCIATAHCHAQADFASKSDRLIVSANASEAFGDVVAAAKLFPTISECNVEYLLSENDGIQLTILTRLPGKFADRVSELKSVNKDLRIEYGLPPLSPYEFSSDALEKFRAKTGVVVFLRADWCPSCEIVEKKELRKQSFLKLLYDANVPVMWADFTDAMTDANAPVARFAKELNLTSTPSFVVYPPNVDVPIVLSNVANTEKLEDVLHRHFASRTRTED